MSELENRIKILEQEFERFKKFMEDEIIALKNGISKTTTQDELDFKELWSTNKNFRRDTLEKFPELETMLDEMLKNDSDNKTQKEASIIWDMCMKYSSSLGKEKEGVIANFIVNLWDYYLWMDE